MRSEKSPLWSTRVISNRCSTSDGTGFTEVGEAHRRLEVGEVVGKIALENDLR